MIINIIFMISSLLTPAADNDFSILSQGFASTLTKSGHMVIRDDMELKKVWEEFAIRDEIPAVNFDEEIVVVLTANKDLGSSIEVSNLRKKGGSILELRYVITRPKMSLGQEKNVGSPYTIAKLKTKEIKNPEIKFMPETSLRNLNPNTAIGQLPARVNDLRGYEVMGVLDYFPIDKGNSWTYKIESDGSVNEEKQSVLTTTDGWSVFDNFFGKENIGFMIDHSGNIIVSHEGNVKNFYTPDVAQSFVKKDFKTPAGKFDNLMVMTIPKNENFWFKDVYAKGVGLIYHEHESHKGNAKYSLINARVRGKNFP